MHGGCDRHAEWRSPQRICAAGRVQCLSHLEVACVSIHHGLTLLEERDLLRHMKNGRFISDILSNMVPMSSATRRRGPRRSAHLNPLPEADIPPRCGAPCRDSCAAILGEERCAL